MSGSRPPVRSSTLRPRPSFRSLARRCVGAALAVGGAAALSVAGWRVCGEYGERCKERGQFFPGYDPNTRTIDLVMHDLNGNGIIDTWIHRSKERIEEIEIDRDEDGTIDRVMFADTDGALHWADASPRP